MTTRTELLNFLVKRYKLKRYLEIGVQNPKNNFDLINATSKTSVDPDPSAGATHRMTSDDFFVSRIPSRYDLVFIDGLHHADQVRRDFINSIKYVDMGGFIVLHDCNPPKEEYTHVPRDSKMWWGDVWRFVVGMHEFGDLNHDVVDIDCGCLVVRKKLFLTIVNTELIKVSSIEWPDFDKNRKELLQLISAADFLKKYA